MFEFFHEPSIYSASSMSQDFLSTMAQYTYEFPAHLIAQSPASPRDSAKLLVYNKSTGKETFTTFRSIAEYLPKRSLLVLNQTKVIPARVKVSRATGGKADLLYLGISDGLVRFLSNRKLSLGEDLHISESHRFTVKAQSEKEWLLLPLFNINVLPQVLEEYGVMPLPPYIKNTPLSADDLKREYQSVFAKHEGSIAAPTASIHFTDALLASLRASGIEIAFVTLHVHLGTFAPLTEEQWQTGLLHEEFYSISETDKAAIMRAKSDNRPVIAVGTTVTRALESSADDCGRILKSEGMTRLFIREPYQFKVVDGMVTNFHVPKSSLLMLVASLIGREKLLDLYGQAIQHNYRLFSFGDAMLIV